jgi:hypothetical protein
MHDGAAAFLGKDQLLTSVEPLLHTIRKVLDDCAV